VYELLGPRASLSLKKWEIKKLNEKFENAWNLLKFLYNDIYQIALIYKLIFMIYLYKHYLFIKINVFYFFKNWEELNRNLLERNKMNFSRKFGDEVFFIFDILFITVYIIILLNCYILNIRVFFYAIAFLWIFVKKRRK
jgi:hypothetical protein